MDITCRICLDKVTKKVQYCKCIGTIGAVHPKCLIRWITMKNHHKCEICQTSYSIQKKLSKAYIGVFIASMILVFVVNICGINYIHDDTYPDSSQVLLQFLFITSIGNLMFVGIIESIIYLTKLTRYKMKLLPIV